jgi:D-alanyl-D-alanine carboxypeptidase
MFDRLIATTFTFALLTAPPFAARSADPKLTTALQRVLDRYLLTRSKLEHISAVSLSISLKGSTQNINLAAGTTKYPSAGRSTTPADLFEIGSNTKAFTSVAILQLEAAGKLSIADTLGKWLPQYPAWKTVTIHELLDMTSPIPGYDNQDSVSKMMGQNPNHTFTPQELVASVYPRGGRPKPVSGWTYSNTNYILAQMIIEKASGESYSEVVRRLFEQTGLVNTYYEQNRYPASIVSRMVSGYFYNHDADNALLKPLLGRDVKNDSVSWMQAAGAIVSDMEDVTRWSRALYEGPLLAEKQRKELTTIVSIKTAKPIAATSKGDPAGFGLGVAQATKPNIGTFWYYEGMTLGYRVAYFYLPESQAVVAVGLNSQPDSKQNKVGDLMDQIYGVLHDAGKL